MSPTDDQYTELAKDLRAATSQLTQTTTVLQQHIVEQRGINKRMDRITGDSELRLRKMENWAAGIQERLPANLVDADEIAHDVEQIENKVARIETKLDGLALKVAKWSGGIAAMVTAGGFFFKWLVG